MALRYTEVPKEAKGSKNWVRCSACGTNKEFSLEAMNNHSLWCGLAKDKAKAAKVKKEKHTKVRPIKY